MKLISLYIENFGGLSGYSLEFTDGVTAVQAPNGFGKTTLAEFIRAMFYGFPRKGKVLEKDRRQKYTPWNGAKAGGNLVFELDGTRYRIERTFGAEPRGDTFRLLDLSTGKKSDRFSREIGTELFQLDADSFERSTYLPQMAEQTGLTTAGIQAKLSDLVEDANDVGNFDKAMVALKNKRSSFLPYRGSGGSVAAAGNHVTRLQQELDRAEMQKAALSGCLQDLAQLEEQLERSGGQLEQIRHQIRLTSEAAARAATRRQYADLEGRYQRTCRETGSLEERYPNGLPGAEETEAARETADRLAVLNAREITTRTDLEAAAFVKENRQRFEGRIPSRTQLEENQRKWDDYVSLTMQAEHGMLSEPEKKQYETLRPVFELGKVTEETLAALVEQNRQLLRQRAALEALASDPAQLERQRELELYFAAGIPETARINLQNQSLSRRDMLRQENLQLAAALPEPGKKISPIPLILALLLAAAGIGTGVAMLVMQSAVVGGIGLGVGVLALIGAIFLGMRLMVNREIAAAGRASDEIRSRMERNEGEAAVLEQGAEEFVRQYSGAMDLREGLREISENRDKLLQLREKHRILEEKRTEAQKEITRLEQMLGQALAPYFGKTTDFDRHISQLRLAREKFFDLHSRKLAAEERSAALHKKAAVLEAELAQFLQPYFEQTDPALAAAQLTQLQRDAERYLQALAQTEQWQTRKQQQEDERNRCSRELEDFFTRYALAYSDARVQLDQIRQDRQLLEDCKIREGRLLEELEAFRAEHGAVLGAPEEKTAGDLDALKQQEKQLGEALTELTAKLLDRRQESRNLRTQADRIPELQEELEYWQEKKNDDQKKAQILDDTMDYLQRARESLTTSYLGPIRESFSGYLQRLMGRKEQILVSAELDVQLERQGQGRELAYFSAGQTDLVMLCMRLALVDALFREEKPFVILDDPFVNLDDARTAEALELLKELGRDRQILYLTCNSSRGLS